ncbi:nickel import ATP-binding protein NikE [Atlantibacter subterranea]|uniref:nickel import ATP-binding protein NikE n=1 Tax=Atlantibacter subterraneus TaxID=255519 RepID=UPI0011837AD5|nr:nickel import ATP-binding protein NikE [Atlantibacter subterranea]TSJ50910.1 nickel import ATP-binding protein NikE [Atlantibacter subterranea]
MTLLSVSNVSHRYGRMGLTVQHHHQVLNGISLAVSEGESVALLGSSGCGKSTLARLLIGLETPTSGDICWRNKPLSTLKGDEMRAFRREIQMVFQDAISAANPRRTVREIIREPLRHLLKLSTAQQNERITRVMAATELDAGLLDKRPPQLSGGQLQRVCLARAMVVEPKLLILDEAVSNLDLVLQANIIQLLKNLQQQYHTACLFITHDLRLVERFCQRVMVMEGGEIVETLPVTSPVAFASAPGLALQRAVLPAFPTRREPRGPGLTLVSDNASPALRPHLVSA